ncbi:MAG TPA: hypothetical protein VF653_17825 [Methylomirabilota bacterium]
MLARGVSLASALCAVAASPAVAAASDLMFAGGTGVPAVVQQFAWRAIQERCRYQAFERRQRAFWAYDAQVRETKEGTLYSIKIVSDVTWKKTEPASYIEIAIVADRNLQLTALRSSSIECPR